MTVIGVLNILFGGVVILGALVFLLVASVGAAFLSSFLPPGWRELGIAFTMLFSVMAVAFAVVGGFALAAGFGLFRRRPWARIATFVLAGLAALGALGSITAFEPVGFVLQGGYAAYVFWALTRPEVGAEFRAQASPV